MEGKDADDPWTAEVETVELVTRGLRCAVDGMKVFCNPQTRRWKKRPDNLWMCRWQKTTRGRKNRPGGSWMDPVIDVSGRGKRETAFMYFLVRLKEVLVESYRYMKSVAYIPQHDQHTTRTRLNV
jgi:hypothetical protein